MSFELIGQNESMSLPSGTWKRLLELARSYGWEPAGTEPPAIRDEDGEYVYDPLDWKGSYTTSEYQNVTADDARAFAAALEFALMDIPDDPATKHDAPGSFSGVRGVDVSKKLNPVEFFTGPIGRGHVVKMIRLSQAGAFEIG